MMKKNLCVYIVDLFLWAIWNFLGLLSSRISSLWIYWDMFASCSLILKTIDRKILSSMKRSVSLQVVEKQITNNPRFWTLEKKRHGYWSRIQSLFRDFLALCSKNSSIVIVVTALLFSGLFGQSLHLCEQYSNMSQSFRETLNSIIPLLSPKLFDSALPTPRQVETKSTLSVSSSSFGVKDFDQVIGS